LFYNLLFVILHQLPPKRRKRQAKADSLSAGWRYNFRGKLNNDMSSY